MDCNSCQQQSPKRNVQQHQHRNIAAPNACQCACSAAILWIALCSVRFSIEKFIQFYCLRSAFFVFVNFIQFSSCHCPGIQALLCAEPKALTDLLILVFPRIHLNFTENSINSHMALQRPIVTKSIGVNVSLFSSLNTTS